MKIKVKRSKRPKSGGRSAKKSHPTQTPKEVRQQNTSFKQAIRKLFDTSDTKGQLTRSKESLLKVALKKAERGQKMTDFLFWKELISLHENEALTEEDLNDFVERVYSIVRRSVEKLEGGHEALAEIARNLQKEEI